MPALPRNQQRLAEDADWSSTSWRRGSFAARPSRKAWGLLVAAAIGSFVVTQAAWAQVGLAEQAGVAAAQGELAGNALKNDGPKKPQDNAPKEVKQKAPENPEKAFAKNIGEASFELKLLLKLISLTVVVLFWVKAGEWINQDAQIFKLGWYKWNHIIFFPFFLVAMLLFFLPVATLVRAPLLLVLFLAIWCPYVLVHNKNVQPHQTVLTGAWWRFAFASLANKVGIKVHSERKAEYEKGAAVDLLAMGGEDANADNANLLAARNSPGYLLVKDVIVEMVNRRCEKTMFDFTKQAVNVRYEIDGVWHNGAATERESGDVMLAVMKTLANLDVKDRRAKQKGKFGAKYEGKSFLCPIVTQGVATGERVVVSRTMEQHLFTGYDDIGMREGLKQQWADLMASDQGLLVLSTLPGGGLTTITNVSLEDTDRLMRDFVSIEDVHHKEREIQNIRVHTYDSAAGETPATILPKVIRNYPNVYICRDFVNNETAELLFKEIRDEHLVVTNIHARDAGEALLRILQKKVSAKDFAATAKAVLYQRLVRLLCAECKVGYTPPADVLRKLGIPQGKIESLYRPPKPEEIDKPCKACQGIGYSGRTGIFELLVVNDQIREILMKQPKLELLRKAARASRQRSLQEEGVLLVARGLTSLPELMRVLKQ
ncbi:MAG: Flp pilus assembly complex ATPase component TadA [Pirellulales bacterium]|nr:Flp pilus assembly complex ATPase component TadA [Pirellulales bacterium]